MNADVLPPNGGYLPVYIEKSGYIVGIDAEAMVHKETTGMSNWRGCFELFSQAKSYALDIDVLPGGHDELVAILQLNANGGGEALWAKPDEIEAVSARRDRFRGCYGAWPVQALSI